MDYFCFILKQNELTTEVIWHVYIQYAIEVYKIAFAPYLEFV